MSELVPADAPSVSREAPAAVCWRERLTNPIVFKDLLAVSASPAQSSPLRRTVVYSLLLAIPLLGLAWAMCFHAGPWRFVGRPVLLGFCALLCFFHVAVAVPAATAFALERDRNTLESLVISPLSPWRLVQGKLMTAVYVGVMGKVAVLPALAVAFVLGGADLAFVPCFLIQLVAVDTSLAAFTLHLGARRREAQSKVSWLKAQTSQTQLVMQATVGVAVMSALIPIYGALLLVPYAMQTGAPLPAALEGLAPIGALHPLAALVLWGDANLFGLRVPIWLLGTVFHLLLALPFVADSAEAQKTEGSEPGRLPRLLALPVLAFVLVLAASICQELGRTAQCLITALLAGVMVIGAAGKTSYSKDPTVKISPARLVAGLWPARALVSAPEGALGFTLLVCLLVGPITIWGAGQGASAWQALGALTLAGLSLAALGARFTARAQEVEDEAFLKALRKRSRVDPIEGADEEEDEPVGSGQKKKGATRSKRPGGILFALSFFAGGLSIFALMLIQKGAAPILAPLKPVFVAAAGAAIASNPFSAILPILTDPNALGSDVVLNYLNALGLDPSILFLCHLATYLGLGALALITLKKPIDLDEAMAEHRAALAAGEVSAAASSFGEGERARSEPREAVEGEGSASLASAPTARDEPLAR